MAFPVLMSDDVCLHCGESFSLYSITNATDNDNYAAKITTDDGTQYGLIVLGHDFHPDDFAVLHHLKSPFLLAYHHYFKMGSSYFAFTDLFQYEDVLTFLKNHKLSGEVLWSLLTQFLCAFRYLNSRKIHLSSLNTFNFVVVTSSPLVIKLATHYSTDKFRTNSLNSSTSIISSDLLQDWTEEDETWFLQFFPNLMHHVYPFAFDQNLDCPYKCSCTFDNESNVSWKLLIADHPVDCPLRLVTTSNYWFRHKEVYTRSDLSLLEEFASLFFGFDEHRCNFFSEKVTVKLLSLNCNISQRLDKLLAVKNTQSQRKIYLPNILLFHIFLHVLLGFKKPLFVYNVEVSKLESENKHFSLFANKIFNLSSNFRKYFLHSFDLFCIKLGEDFQTLSLFQPLSVTESSLCKKSVLNSVYESATIDQIILQSPALFSVNIPRVLTQFSLIMPVLNIPSLTSIINYRQVTKMEVFNCEPPELLSDCFTMFINLEFLILRYCDYPGALPRLFATNQDERSPPTLRHIAVKLWGLTDVSSLTICVKLQSIDLSQTWIRDLNWMIVSVADQLSPSFPDLIILNVSGTYVSDISVLSCYSNIEEICLRNTAVCDLWPLFYCKKLSKLDVRETFISYELQAMYLNQSLIIRLSEQFKVDIKCDLSLVAIDDTLSRCSFNPGPSASKFSFFNFSNKSMVLASRIDVCTNLKELKLENCQLTSLQFASRLTLLEVLDVAKNPISDLSPVANCISLQSLCLESTHVSSLDIVHNLPLLSFLDTREILMPFFFYKIYTTREDVVKLLDVVSLPLGEINDLFFAELEKISCPNQRSELLKKPLLAKVLSVGRTTVYYCKEITNRLVDRGLDFVKQIYSDEDLFRMTFNDLRREVMLELLRRDHLYMGEGVRRPT
ncbi:hypothetical protein RCL1_002943 [Eukaryota sp. TZLM3-RCL]